MTSTYELFGSDSRCCRSPSLIVQSRQGGFISQNCTTCEKPRRITLKELPELYCFVCCSEMEAFQNDQSNYAYYCEECDSEIELANLVPFWNEVFDEYGLGLETDPDY